MLNLKFSLTKMAPNNERCVYVYTGLGASPRSSLSAIYSLRRALSPSSVTVAPLDTSSLLSGNWCHSALCLVMPGGADLPYCRLLNGHGNSIIKTYVENGGSYLGLCAGAYYACARVEFEPGTALEVVGDRELAFFPGVAIGSLYSGFTYQSEHGAHVVPLKYSSNNNNGSDDATWIDCVDYINGGPKFAPYNNTNASLYETLAVYPEKSNALAAVRCTVRKGIAVLCATHPELDAKWISESNLHELGAVIDDKLVVDILLAKSSSSSNHDCINSKVNQAKLPENVVKLKEILTAHGEDRQRYLNRLLIAAGLEEFLSTVFVTV